MEGSKESKEVMWMASVFAALGHPRRVEIVRALARWSDSPSDLARRLGCSWTTIAKHLKVLQAAGLVERSEAEYGPGYSYALSGKAFEWMQQCVGLLQR